MDWDSPRTGMDPRQLPTGRKVLECRAEPLTYTLCERRGIDRQGRRQEEKRKEEMKRGMNVIGQKAAGICTILSTST